MHERGRCRKGPKAAHSAGRAHWDQSQASGCASSKTNRRQYTQTTKAGLPPFAAAAYADASKECWLGATSVTDNACCDPPSLQFSMDTTRLDPIASLQTIFLIGDAQYDCTTMTQHHYLSPPMGERGRHAMAPLYRAAVPHTSANARRTCIPVKNDLSFLEADRVCYFWQTTDT